MNRFLEKIYIIFKLMQIARQNKARNKFYRKYEFEDYGEDLDNACLVKAVVDGKGLKEIGKDYYSTDNKIQTDDYGIKEYVDQQCGYCEDDYSGTIYRKTPIKGFFIKTWFQC